MINALTIDVEDWFQGLELGAATWGGFEPRLAVGLERLLSLLHEKQVRATFFVLGSAAERHPEWVRRIAEEGHEVGAHGMSHSFLYRLGPARFAEELRLCLQVLSDVTGRPVHGHRAPFFSLTRDAWWAFDVLAAAGISYDSSIFPVHNYRYGIPGAPRFPFLAHGAEAAVAEFPISTYRLGRATVPFSGGFYLRFWPYRFIRHCLRRVNAEGQPAVVYLHPWELDPDHPRLPLPRRISLTHYHNLASTYAKLSRLLAEFRFAPMNEVLRRQPALEAAA